MAGSRIAVTLARTAVLVWLVVQGHGLVTVALVYGISELIVNLIYLVLALRLLPAQPFSRSAIDVGLLREMLHYGFNTFNYILGALLLLKVGEVLIGIYRSAEEVAHYAIVTASVLTLTTVIEAFCAAIKPAASDLDATDDHVRLKELTLLSQKYSLFLILPSAAFLLIMGREFLAIWTHKEIPLLPTILAIVVAGHAFRLVAALELLRAGRQGRAPLLRPADADDGGRHRRAGLGEPGGARLGSGRRGLGQRDSARVRLRRAAAAPRLPAARDRLVREPAPGLGAGARRRLAGHLAVDRLEGHDAAAKLARAPARGRSRWRRRRSSPPGSSGSRSRSGCGSRISLKNGAVVAGVFA